MFNTYTVPFLQYLSLNIKFSSPLREYIRNIYICFAVDVVVFLFYRGKDWGDISNIIRQIIILNHMPYAYLNPLQSNISFLHPLRTSVNVWFYDFVRGYRHGTLAPNRLMKAHLALFSKPVFTLTSTFVL